jgi:hypothetical protein
MRAAPRGYGMLGCEYNHNSATHDCSRLRRYPHFLFKLLCLKQCRRPFRKAPGRICESWPAQSLTW